MIDSSEQSIYNFILTADKNVVYNFDLWNHISLVLGITIKMRDINEQLLLEV